MIGLAGVFTVISTAMVDWLGTVENVITLNLKRSMANDRTINLADHPQVFGPSSPRRLCILGVCEMDAEVSAKRSKEELAAFRKPKEVWLEGRELYISDHAVLRYAERVMGVPPLEVIRRKMKAHIQSLGSLKALTDAGYKVVGRSVRTFIKPIASDVLK